MILILYQYYTDDVSKMYTQFKRMYCPRVRYHVLKDRKMDNWFRENIVPVTLYLEYIFSLGSVM